MHQLFRHHPFRKNGSRLVVSEAIKALRRVVSSALVAAGAKICKLGPFGLSLWQHEAGWARRAAPHSRRRLDTTNAAADAAVPVGSSASGSRGTRTVRASDNLI